MSILWGAWSSNNRTQAGSELTMSPAVVGPSTATVTITQKLYARVRYSSNESGGSTTPWAMTNGFTPASGYGSGFNLGAMGVKLIGTSTRVVATSYSNTQSVSTQGSWTSTYAYPGTRAAVINSIVVPKRPYAGPADPTGVAASRINDNQARLVWVNHGTVPAPITSNTIYMRSYFAGWGDWVAISTSSGSATSLTVTGLTGDRLYQFFIRANNDSGSSANVVSNQVAMSPAAPMFVSSGVTPDGAGITTSWLSSIYGRGVIPAETFIIQRSTNGGAYVTVASGVTATTWTDPTPGGGNNQYRVRTVPYDPTVASDYAYGNVVSTIVAPLAPTGLSPNGVAVDLLLPVTLSWTHNPGGDRAAQTHFTIQTSSDGGTTWVTRANNVTSGVSSWVMPGATLTNGVAYQWRVQTQGAVGAAYGPYSTVATITGSKTPVVTITYPGASITALPLTVTRTYTQAQSSPQASTTTELYNQAGTQLLETVTTTGPGLTHTFATRVQDGTSYLIRVQSTSAAGVVSAWVTKTVPVVLPVPAAATIDGSFQPCDGTVVLSLAALAPVGAQIAVSYLILERRINGTGAWVVLSDHFVPPGDFIDPLPPLNGFVEYRVTSVSTAPSYRLNAPVTVTTAVGGQLWVFLSFGPGFTRVVRVRGNPRIGEVTGRERAVQPMAGRQRPLLQVGANTTRVVSFAGALYYDAECVSDDPCAYDTPPVGWRTASQEADVVAYRDYHGRRLFGMLSDVSVDEGETLGVGTVGFSVTEDDTVVGYATGMPG